MMQKKDNSENKRKKLLKELMEWTAYILSAFVIASLLHSQVFAVTTVYETSMENTLFEGQTLIIEKITYGINEPKQGDIIVFLENSETSGFINKLKILFNDVNLKIKGDVRKDRLIKRVIAIEGDEIEIKDGYVYVNGTKLDEPYTKTITSGKAQSVTVPEGHIYVMGDNRAASKDSRFFGSIRLDHVEGKVLIRLLPISEMGKP